MKFILYLVFSAAIAIAATFPNIKIGDSSPIKSNVLLEINSTSKGVLIPRMSSTDRNAIISSAAISSLQGLLVWDTSLQTICQANSTVSTWSCAAPQSSAGKLVENRVLVSDGNGFVANSSVTSTQLNYLGALPSTLNNGRVLVTSSGFITELDSYGSNTYVLTSNGNGVLPSWQSAFSPAQTVTDWSSTAVSFTNSGWGTTTLIETYSKRIGDTLRVRGHFTAGTVTANPGYIEFTGLTIDQNKLFTHSVAGSRVGHIVRVTGGASLATTIYTLYFDGFSNHRVYFANSPNTDGIVSSAVNGTWGAGEGAHFEFEVPILEWD